MIQGDPGPITERTDRNIRAARCWRFQAGRWLVEYKFFTGACKVRPRLYSGVEPFFNEGLIKWYRWYFLTFGVFISRKF